MVLRLATTRGMLYAILFAFASVRLSVSVSSRSRCPTEIGPNAATQIHDFVTERLFVKPLGKFSLYPLQYRLGHCADIEECVGGNSLLRFQLLYDNAYVPFSFYELQAISEQVEDLLLLDTEGFLLRAMVVRLWNAIVSFNVPRWHQQKRDVKGPAGTGQWRDEIEQFGAIIKRQLEKDCYFDEGTVQVYQQLHSLLCRSRAGSWFEWSSTL